MNLCKARWLLFVFLVLGTWVVAQAAQQQSNPPYRPPRLATPAAPSPTQPTPAVPPAQTAPGPTAQPSPQATQPSPQPAQQARPVQASGGNWSPTKPPQIYTVSVHNSPSVPDRGSNCIICGLVTGNFTAVEPNLGICAQATSLPGATLRCAMVCQHGHDCKIDFNSPVRLNYPNPSVHLQVWNIDVRDDKAVDKLADFDEPDATACTSASPCSVPNPAGGAAMQVSFDFGTVECNDASYQPASISSSGPTLFATPTEGMRPDPGQSAIPPNQHDPWREYFCLAQPSQKGGWVVQQIQFENPTHPQPTVFWETFVVLPGEQHSAYPDTFNYDFGARQNGFMSVNANATFYEGLSNDFVRTHFFLNMPNSNLDIVQSSGEALSTTDSSVVKQLNQLVTAGTVKASNNLYRAWHLTFKDGHIVP